MAEPLNGDLDSRMDKLAALDSKLKEDVIQWVQSQILGFQQQETTFQAQITGLSEQLKILSTIIAASPQHGQLITPPATQAPNPAPAPSKGSHQRKSNKPQSRQQPNAPPQQPASSNAQPAPGQPAAPNTASTSSTQASAVGNTAEVVDGAGGRKRKGGMQTKAVKKAKSYALHNDAFPKIAGDLRKAMLLHIHILWGLYKSTDIPPDPHPLVVQSFSTKFAMDTDLIQTLKGRTPIVDPSGVKINPIEAITDSGSTFANCSKVEEGIITYMKVCIAQFGLSLWCPDLRQTPYSLYNSACHIIAIDTFKQALISGAYDQVYSVDPAFVTNTALLIKLFDHFVFSFFLKHYRRDVKNPGLFAHTDRDSSMYKNCERLVKQRRLWLHQNGYPTRYMWLISTEATSEDERDPEGSTENGRDVYLIKKKFWRSDKMERFIRKMDNMRIRGSQLKYGKRSAERIRKVPANPGQQLACEFNCLPERLPIEAYNPEVYNDLTPALRAHCAAPQVVFPQNMDDLFTGNGDKTRNTEELNILYGKEVMAPYHYINPRDLPDEDDLDSDDAFGDDVDIDLDDNTDIDPNLMVQDEKDGDYGDDDVDRDSKRRKLADGIDSVL
ncbi:hypothetical protein EST38_g12922 [Candolleomyces aberdarensis]|uniref:Uncharacterized protein n=1 Tax=Candolleomyces aberdarensis TaxID=2316362 RepID=A0A4Q2D2E0_9AGAR|nr:hypothetical protein EST38_g12922 [Candolleomyces aberdarensis]